MSEKKREAEEVPEKSREEAEEGRERLKRKQQKREAAAAAAAAAESDEFDDPDNKSALSETMEQNAKRCEEMAAKDQERELEMKRMNELLEALTKRMEEPIMDEGEREKLWKQFNTTTKQLRMMGPAQPAVPGKIPPYLVGRVPTDECIIDVKPGKGMVVNFTWKILDGIELNPRDCIRLYAHDHDRNNHHCDEPYLLKGEPSGSGSFQVPGVGYYDLRYFPKSGPKEHSRSLPFLIGDEMKLAVERPSRYEIVVRWDRNLQMKGDWLGLYNIETYNAEEFIAYEYAPSKTGKEDKVVFHLPRTPGTYEVRYFFTSKRQAGKTYAYSGKSEPIVVTDEDKMEIIQTHPVTKIRWQTSSQEPNRRDYVGIYASKDKSCRDCLAWVRLNPRGTTLSDQGVAEVTIPLFKNLAEDAVLPDEAYDYEVRIYCTGSKKKPLLVVPFLKQ